MNVAVLAAFGAARFASPHTFTYAFDGDTNGLFFGLGRQLSQVAWQNPQTLDTALIGVFHGTNVANLGQGTLAGVVNRDYADENRSDNDANSYWRCDVGSGKTMAVSKYSYKCRPAGQGDASNIGDFKFQGSADSSSWTDLDTRTGITYVDSDDWKTFTISSPQAFRYNRILNNGNVTPANNFFFLTEWEFYGVYTF